MKSIISPTNPPGLVYGLACGAQVFGVGFDTSSSGGGGANFEDMSGLFVNTKSLECASLEFLF